MWCVDWQAVGADQGGMGIWKAVEDWRTTSRTSSEAKRMDTE